MNKSLFGLTTILVLSIGMTPAFATITGEVENNSSYTLNGAWVNAEASGEFVHTTQPNSGDYTISNPVSSGNTVSASQYYYEREELTSVSDGATNKDFTLGYLSIENLAFVIYVDGVNLGTARNHVNDAEDYFQVEHSINFNEVDDGTWDIEGNTSCDYALERLEAEANWATVQANSDILIGFVDVQLYDSSGTTQIVACTREPYGSSESPSIVIGSGVSDYPLIVMHEITHDYDIDHTTGTCATQIPNVMAAGCGGISGVLIKNWTPTHDSTMQSNRDWY